MSYVLRLNHHFDAAHRLKLPYTSACNDLHGHRWKVEVEIETPRLNNEGMVFDFKKLKSIIDELDHSFLNKKVDFNPTAENLAKYLHDKVDNEINDTYSLVKITIWESPEASISYSV